ncbi:MAG: T9SS type A sorting domain-containing protein [Chlorobiota bacterium]|nr:MAG: T9SS type A sorting domain-containing protein [Chlorobiota bacterium]
MKKILSNSLIIIASITSCAFTYSMLLNGNSNYLKRNFNFEEKVENPDELAYIEYLKLRDPVTNQIPEDIANKSINFVKGLPKVNNSLLSKSTVSNYSWINRGPVNVGGRTRALAFDVTNDSIILSGGVTGDLWRSVDQGMSWSRTKTPPNLPNVSCITQDTRKGKTNVWYMGSGESPLYTLLKSDTSARRSYQSDGISKSVDGGLNWKQLPSTVSKTPNKVNPFDFINKIIVPKNINDKDLIFASTIGGIMKSENGGITWNLSLGDSVKENEYSDIAITSSGTIFGSISKGKSKGLYKTIDGVNWDNISFGFIPDTCGRIVLATAPSNPNILYAIFSTSVRVNNRLVEGFKIGRYTLPLENDSLGKWEDISGLQIKTNQGSTINSQGGYCLVLAIKPDDENVIYFAGTNLYRNIDGGKSVSSTAWLGGYDPKNNSYSLDDPTKLHPDIQDIVFFPNNPKKMFVLCDGGLRFTNDNSQSFVQWNQMNNGYVTGQFYSVGVDHETVGSNVLVGGLQDNGSWATLSSDPDEPWALMNSGDGMHAQVVDSGRYFLVSTQSGKVSLAKANKKSTDKNIRVYPDSATGIFINPFATDPSDRKIIYLPLVNKIYRKLNVINNDTNKNWIKIYDGIDTYTAVGVSQNAPSNRLYFGSSNGKLYRLDNANDTNLNFTNADPVLLKSTLFPKGGWINCISVDPLNGDRAIVVFTNYNVRSLFYTIDGGINWESIGGNLEEFPNGSGSGPSCRWAQFVNRPEGLIVFVATNLGLYSSKILNGDNTNWELEGEGTPLEYAVCEMIDTRQSDGFTGIATHGKGMFSGTPFVTSIKNDYNNDYNNIMVNPNPVNSNSKIYFKDKIDFSSIKLFDVNGKFVKLIYEGIISNNVPIESKDLPNGFYNVVIRNKDFIISKKIIIKN